MSEPTLQWFEGYEIRTGGDGKVGIYTRGYNVRLATFNANTAQLQTRLKLLFERANAPKPILSGKKSRKADKRQNPGARSIRRHPKPPRNEAWGKGSGNW